MNDLLNTETHLGEMSWVFTFPQLVGYLALVLSLVQFQVKSQRTLFGLNMLSDLVWVLHYVLLGGIAPAISIGISALRTLLTVFLVPRWKGPVSLVAFITITALIIAMNDAGWRGYLPVLAAAAFSLAAFHHESYAASRACIAIGMAVWVGIGFAFGSIGEVLSSTFALASLALGGWRHCKARNG